MLQAPDTGSTMLHPANPHAPLTAGYTGLWAALAAVVAAGRLRRSAEGSACAAPGECAGTGTTPAAAPATAPPPPAAAPDPTPADRAAAQKTALSAVDMLAAGNEEQATAELNRALDARPDQQAGAEPDAPGFRGSGCAATGASPSPMWCKPGESLSQIAGRFMGDIYAFYGLARYNDIKVPRQVAGGQSLRVPGKPTAGATAPDASRTRATRPPAEPPQPRCPNRHGRRLEPPSLRRRRRSRARRPRRWPFAGVKAPRRRAGSTPHCPTTSRRPRWITRMPTQRCSP